MRADCLRVRVQIEHARDRRGERVCVPARGAVDGGDDAALAWMQSYGQRAGVAGPVDRAAIGAVLDRFDAWRRAPFEETQQARPVERRLERQLERGAMSNIGRQAA